MKVEIVKICIACGGSGKNPDKPNEICRICNGSGEVTEKSHIKRITIEE